MLEGERPFHLINYRPSDLSPFEILTQHGPIALSCGCGLSLQCSADSGAAGCFSCWKLPAPELSADSVLSELAEQSSSSFQAAITASAFTALMATLPTDQSSSWELPVQTTELTLGPPSSPAGDLGGRAVLIDKPLQPRFMNLRQKHERLYKAAVLALGTSNEKVVRAPLDAMGHEARGEGSHATDRAVLGSSGMYHNLF